MHYGTGKLLCVPKDACFLVLPELNMLKITSKQHGLYREKLLPDARNRYHEKINLIGNVDPYEIPKQWIRDPDALPPVTFADIFTYLVCCVSALYSWTVLKL